MLYGLLLFLYLLPVLVVAIFLFKLVIWMLLKTLKLVIWLVKNFFVLLWKGILLSFAIAIGRKASG
ncbi:hypothetical protein [Bacteroides sp. HPS0048]|uniref:hypothetical protein n=1 Tax=Bacteroides sp. HPS0048 TaxID=1078089 RepID=UPI0005C66905|nr:hypothetical protein [Bacteroides sp. HPS0048]